MTPTQRKAMEQALKALELWNSYAYSDIITTLRAALAEQPAEQEPLAWVVDMNGTESLEWHSDVQADLIFGTAVQPLYPEAPQPAKPAEQPVVPTVCIACGSHDGHHQNCARVRWGVDTTTEASQPAKHPFLVRDLAELIGSTVPDVCNALEDMGIEPRRSTNAAVTPDEALAVARRLAQPAIPPGHKLVPIEPTEAMWNAMMDWGTKKSEWLAILNAAPEAPQPAIPPGYKLVPVEPTDEMIDAAKNNGAEGSRKEIAGDYKAMLNAAPEAPQPAKRVQLADEEITAIAFTQHNYPQGTVGSAMFRKGVRYAEAAHGITGEPT